MELTNRLILGIAYVFVGVIIGGVSFAAFRFYGGTGYREQAEALATRNASDGETRGRAGDPGYTRGVHIQQLYAQRAQIVRLQRLLEQKTALLDRKTALLDKKTAEQQSLQAELDNAIDLLETLTAELAPQGAAPSRTTEDNDQLKSEVERLRSDSAKSRAVAEEQQAELDLLMMELAVTDESITELEEQAEAELARLLEQRNAFETVVSVAFAQMGEEVVPILVDYLAHEEADVRRWAAVTLGEVGPLARDAIPPLLEAKRDVDPSVRRAAEDALEKIDRIGS